MISWMYGSGQKRYIPLCAIWQKDCTFTVDPYSYEITVDGVDEETKVLMQNALNVGNNGKNLYKHIYYYSTQDGCESSQVTEESKMKYEAYHQVYSYTGYELDKLEPVDYIPV